MPTTQNFKDMMNRIALDDSKQSQDRAYEVFCAKRFRALLVAREDAGTYSGDDEAMEMFCAELEAVGVPYMNVNEDPELGHLVY